MRRVGSFRSLSLACICLGCCALIFLNSLAEATDSGALKSLPPFALRSNLYFGTRTTTQDALAFMTGLGWFVDDRSESLRYSCSEKDGLEKWGWARCETSSSYGLQLLPDPSSGVNLTVEFVADDRDPRSWSARVSGSLHENKRRNDPTYLSLVLTFSSPQLMLPTEAALSSSKKGLRDTTVQLVDQRPGEGGTFTVDWAAGDGEQLSDEDLSSACTEYTMKLRGEGRGPAAPELSRTHFSAYRTRPDDAWRVQDRLSAEWRASSQKAASAAKERKLGNHWLRIPLLSNSMEPLKIDGNVTVIALQRVLTLPFVVDLRFDAGGQDEEPARPCFNKARAVSKKAEVEARYDQLFLKKSALTNYTEMGLRGMSNLLCSQTYFYGTDVVVANGRVEPPVPAELFTGVPSRSFFPRGFLWDEGFHQVLTGRWDKQQAQRVLWSWLLRYKDDGWVAREQILGAEARAKVPEQFRAQFVEYANPPTMLLAVERMLGSAAEEDTPFLLKAYAVLSKSRAWLESTQKSPRGGLAWQGRSEDGRHTLTSGIDDYPRGRGPKLGPETHVDLHAWAAWSDLALIKLGTFLKRPLAEMEALKTSYETHVHFIESKLWNDRLGVYNDWGNVDGNYVKGLGSAPQTPSESGLVPHVGYIGILPVCLGLTKDPARLSKVLDHFESEASLRAPGIGLRSLARSDAYFGTDENYWRGAVWINVNYLCVHALKTYAESEELPSVLRQRAKRLELSLTRDILSNIHKEWERTGFYFENYDGITGRGRGTRPFTGWSTLAVLLIADHTQA